MVSWQRLRWHCMFGKCSSSDVVQAVIWFIVGSLSTYFIMSGGSCSKLSEKDKDFVLKKKELTLKGKPIPQTAPSVADNVEKLLVINQTDAAGILAEKVRVLCLVITTSMYHNSRAIHVKATWGRRCTKMVFVSDKEDKDLPAIAASAYNDYLHVWSKTRGGFKWAYDNHINDFDWFLKADDDTYIIMENLRSLLVQHNPNDEVYLGHHFANPEWQDPHGYASGGAGYVLSRKAVERLAVSAFSMTAHCSPPNVQGTEDSELGRCLEHIGIVPGETRDALGKHRFFPFPPWHHLMENATPPDFWLWKYAKYPYTEGDDCCSRLSISFHYIPPEFMRTIDFLIYRLRLFGDRLIFPTEDVQARQAKAYRIVQETLLNSSYVERSV